MEEVVIHLLDPIRAKTCRSQEAGAYQQAPTYRRRRLLAGDVPL